MIGRRCKRGNTLSRPVLIGRGLGLNTLVLALESLREPPSLTTDFGDHSDRVTPVPISNTEVKPVSADGTWGVIPWESRTSPDFDQETHRPDIAGGAFSAFSAPFAAGQACRVQPGVAWSAMSNDRPSSACASNVQTLLVHCRPETQEDRYQAWLNTVGVGPTPSEEIKLPFSPGNFRLELPPGWDSPHQKNPK